MNEQKPSVGRIVHYQSYGTPNGEYKSKPIAAVITEVFSDTCVNLFVMNPSGLFFNQSVVRSDEPKAGHWNFPPRV